MLTKTQEFWCEKYDVLLLWFLPFECLMLGMLFPFYSWSVLFPIAQSTQKFFKIWDFKYTMNSNTYLYIDSMPRTTFLFYFWGSNSEADDVHFCIKILITFLLKVKEILIFFIVKRLFRQLKYSMDSNESNNSVYSCSLLLSLTVAMFTAFHLGSQKTEGRPQVIKSSPQCSLEAIQLNNS